MERSSKPLRLGVLISGAGSTLRNLIERIGDGRLRGVEIALVISSRGDVTGVEIARRAGLPLDIIRKREFTNAGSFSNALTAALRRARVDLVVMGGFLCHWRIPPDFVGRAINIHPALLPAFGGKGMHGLHVHAAVLASAAAESGCTVHLVDDEYDHGPILAQRRLNVLPDECAESLQARIGELERELYPDVIQQIAERGIEWLRAQAAG